MIDSLYPALDRFFENKTQMAHAANRSRDYLWRCLTGQRNFTRADKKAISANIMARLLSSPSYDYQDLVNAQRAWEGKFDEIYRRKEKQDGKVQGV